MNIIQFKSNEKATPFAPEWNYYIGETNINDWDSQKPDPASSKAPWTIYNIGNNKPVKLMDYIEALEKII